MNFLKSMKEAQKGYDAQFEKLRIMTESAKIRISVTNGNHIRVMWVYLDKLTPDQRNNVENALDFMLTVADEATDEITVSLVKENKKV
jgi:hypothetical protein